MKLAALFSGGKDSTYALWLASREHEIKFLVSMRSRNRESYMFHTAGMEMTEIQAEAMGIELIKMETDGIKEEELNDLEKILSELKEKGIEGITSGAVASNYQKTRIESICKKLGLECLSPLWGRDPGKLLKEMVDNGFEIIIVAVAAGGLDQSWLGRKMDSSAIRELEGLNAKHGIHVMGEGGEYETMVTDCPFFGKRIVIEDSEKKWDSTTRSGELEIRKAALKERHHA